MNISFSMRGTPIALWALGGMMVAAPRAWCASPDTTTQPTQYVIDLAEMSGVTSQQITAGTIQIAITHMIPGIQYTVTIDRIAYPVMPGPLPNPPTTRATGGTCQTERDSIMSDLRSAMSEAAVADDDERIKELDEHSCTPTEIAQARRDFDARTSRTLAAVTLGQGDQLVIQVSRAAGTGTKGSVVAASFPEYTFEVPPPPSQWLVLYGFNYVHAGDELYFAKQNAAAPGSGSTTYTITPEANRNHTVFAPSVYFMWAPAKNPTNYFSRVAGWHDHEGNVFGGLTAGLGFDTSNPVVFFGYGVGWGYNVMLTAGVAWHKEKRLLGQYSAGEVVGDNLTTDQLTQDTYQTQFYIGLAFRFGSNPFSGNAGGGSTGK